MYDKNPRQQNAVLEKKLRGKLSVHFLKEISPGYVYFPEWQIYRKWNILFLNYVIILTTGLRAKVIKLEYNGVGVSTFFVDCTRFWRSTAPPRCRMMRYIGNMSIIYLLIWKKNPLRGYPIVSIYKEQAKGVLNIIWDHILFQSMYSWTKVSKVWIHYWRVKTLLWCERCL